jgi:hypothetical protein
MTFLHINKQRMPHPDGPQAGYKEVFTVPAVAITTGQGRKLIPNPHGTETVAFNSLEEAEEAVRRAGFDYIFEGKKTYTMPPPAASGRAPGASLSVVSSGTVSWQDAVTLLIERLQDREPSVIAHAAFALGELQATQAVRALILHLGHEDSGVRKEVSEALAKLGEPALPHLRAAYTEARTSREKNASYVRLSVINSYLQLTYTHRELLERVLPQVIDALSDESWLVRSQAALVIGQSAQYFQAPPQ